MLGNLVIPTTPSFSFDNNKGDIVFISHAHTDHVPQKYFNYFIASKETSYLAGIKGNRWNKDNFSLYDAGHMVGARQIAFDLEGMRIVYTGDFRLKEGIFGEKAEFVEGDVIVIDGTFAYPEFKFPDPFEMYEEIASWIASMIKKGRNVFIRAYPLGKTQEVVKLLNEYLSLSPVLHRKNFKYTRKYEELGYKMDYVAFDSLEGKKLLKEGGVGIFPTNISTLELKLYSRAVFSKPSEVIDVSGWVLKFRKKGFPLSDHSDFYDIIEYVRNSNASHIFVVGEHRYIKKYVKDSNVYPVSHFEQWIKNKCLTKIT